MSPILLYLASAIVASWGVAHLLATRGVVAGFGDLTVDNRRIITMEWIMEGVALISVAAFVAVTASIQAEVAVARAIFATAITSLVAFALVSLFTGARIAFPPFRLCPAVLGTSAAMIAWGAWG